MIQRSTTTREPPFYIESDGEPMGETELHFLNILYLVQPLIEWFAADPMVYVGGNMFIHYERGNSNRHVSPDVFVVRGVPKDVRPRRRNYLVWEEGQAPQFVVEFTSETTREVDRTTKHAIYQDVLRVREYFQFDPFEEYLHPRLQGFRLASGSYRPIRPVKGRLPSKVLGLHLEADGELLRLYDPTTRRRRPIPPEVIEAQKRSEAARRQEARGRREEARGRQEEARARQEIQAENERLARAQQEEARARQEVEAENERLRRENEELRRRLPGAS